MEFILRRIAADVLVPEDAAYIEQVQDVLEHPSFQSMASYLQHGSTSCLAHCVAVSYLSYQACLSLGLDARAAARGGLLHDMFLYDWHTRFEQTGERFHGFTHPRVALKNARELFELTPLEEEIIQKHMWPLTLSVPRNAEAYVVIYYDKYCSLRETFGKPVL